MKRRTAAECIAFHLGWDFAEMADCRYQPSRYRIAVYVVGDDYVCCPAVGQKPPAPNEFAWRKVGESYGRAVFRASPAPTGATP